MSKSQIESARTRVNSSQSGPELEWAERKQEHVRVCVCVACLSCMTGARFQNSPRQPEPNGDIVVKWSFRTRSWANVGPARIAQPGATRHGTPRPPGPPNIFEFPNPPDVRNREEHGNSTSDGICLPPDAPASTSKCGSQGAKSSPLLEKSTPIWPDLGKGGRN